MCLARDALGDRAIDEEIGVGPGVPASVLLLRFNDVLTLSTMSMSCFC